MKFLMKIVLFVSMALSAFLNAAGLEFAQKLQEIHAPADVDKVTADFAFTNRSDKPVRVAKYDAACSCMAVTIGEGKFDYQPGESGVIRAVFEMGNFSGTVDKVVAIWLDDDPSDKPSVSLTVRVHIPVLVALEPKTLTWALNGEATPQTIRITMNDSKPIRVTGVSSSLPEFKPVLKTIEEGKSYELVVTPEDVKSPGLGILRIETDSTNVKHKSHQAFAVVRKPTAPKP